MFNLAWVLMVIRCSLAKVGGIIVQSERKVRNIGSLEGSMTEGS